MKRIEAVILAFFLASWFVGLLSWIGTFEMVGRLDIALYPLYAVAAFAGWLLGNIYVHRSRSAVPSLRNQLLVVYFLGPLGSLYLLRAMAPAEVQSAAPLVPLWTIGVFTTFFLVPVTLRGSGGSRRELEIGRRSPPED